MAIRNNPFRPIIKKIPAPFRNKYFLTIVLFLAWMIFFDKHDMLTNFKLSQTQKTLEEDLSFYKKNIKETKADRLDLEQNKEKFAREHYYMQKSDEDVFIIVDESKKE